MALTTFALRLVQILPLPHSRTDCELSTNVITSTFLVLVMLEVGDNQGTCSALG